MGAERLRRDPREEVKRIGALVADEMRFFRTWASKPLTTGAVSPSGRSLARAMAARIDGSWPGVVVELGPGTGAVTAALIERGVEPERLVAVEYNGEFARHISRRFRGLRVIEGDAYDLAATLARHEVGPVAAVVSSLPLFTRPMEERRDLVSRVMDLVPPGRPLVQFSYALVPPVPAEPGRWSLDVSDWILMNLPPARVWTYQAPAAA